jgi:hypothetical protein
LDKIEKERKKMKTTLEKTVAEMRKVAKATKAAKKRGVTINSFVHVDFPDESGQYLGYISSSSGVISIEQLRWRKYKTTIRECAGGGINLQECVKNFLKNSEAGKCK